MNRFQIVFKMGEDDEYVSPESVDYTANIDICHHLGGLKYCLGGVASQLSELQLVPSEVGIDFSLLGGAVYAADTRISRARYAQDGWTREITIVLPVSNRPLWESQRRVVERILKFLTGDHWTVLFRERPERYSVLVGRLDLQLPLERFTAVNLFSGGLDSLVGAVDSLADGIAPLFVSHHGEGKSSVAQRRCFSRLADKFEGRDIKRLSSGICFPKDIFPWEVAEESSTRGRSFLFFSQAAVAVTALSPGAPIIVPENGLISLNIPVDTLRLGALSTRTTHPYYMGLWSELLLGVGVGSGVVNPYQMKTKGEMLSECRDVELLREMIPISVSCSNPTHSRYAQDEIDHCGQCVPCIIRRASIMSAFGEDDTLYRLAEDVLSSRELNTNRGEGQNYRAFEVALSRIGDNPGLAEVLVHKSGPLPGGRQALRDFTDLYLRGMREVGAFLEGVETRPLR